MKNKKSLGLSVLLLLLISGTSPVVHAQFGNFLQQLQKALPTGATGPTAATGPTSASNSKRSGGLMPSTQWCSAQAGALGSMKVDTQIIASEFNIPDLESLQDQFLLALRKVAINKTFPSAKFFQASFETKKVRAIYDTFLAFPEPDTLAALIQISRSSDQQEQADALMALAFLHLQAPELSINKDRWRALFQQASRSEHFTTLVFRARMAAYGEYGKKDLHQALGDLVSAGGLRQSYTQNDGIKKEFDTQNYELIHTATAMDIYNNEPKMPYRQQWQGPAQMGMQIKQAQDAYARQLPNTRVGRMFAEANRFNAVSIQIGNDIIKTTQGGNALIGQLASMQSLQATNPGEISVFVDASPEVKSAQLKMFSKMDSLDPQQKSMLSQAHENRLAAQGIISQSYGELLQMMIANFSTDMVKMAAPLPALAQANNALIQSCILSAKWEQAMRAKDVPKPDVKKSEAMVSASLQTQYKD